jgi:hypothetical protein
MNHIEIDVQLQWPKMKLIINGPRGIKVTESFYDTALTNFEVEVRNELQFMVNGVIKKRKEQ